jgi:radical SAM protein with 4Fe4S-binding SPASM domain
MLIGLLTSSSVPADLVYFRDGGRNLVVNPELGVWQLLDDIELSVLRALANGWPLPHGGDRRDEGTLAKLVMSRLAYLPGQAPQLRQVDAALNLVYYAITEGCNLRCPYCYASSEKRLPGELSTEESLALVDQVAELGAQTMVFTGGEPMLRRDLFQVAGRARELGMRANIITNATLIRKPAMAQRIADTFSTVTVSMDGGTAAIHEKTRGAGTFAKTVAALRMLNDVGVRPTINHVVTEDNVGAIDALAELLADIDIVRVRLMQHSELGRGATDNSSFGWPEYKQVHQFIWTDPRGKNLIPDGAVSSRRSSTVQVNCGLGGNEIYVNSLGDVFPCKLVTGRAHKAGNLREDTLRSLFAMPVLKDLRSNAVFAGENLADCRRCYIRGACAGGCRAYHMAKTGDLKRNSRQLCRLLRHQMITSMWVGAGAGRTTLVDREEEAYRPLMVRTGEEHPVYRDWIPEVEADRAKPLPVTTKQPLQILTGRPA